MSYCIRNALQSSWNWVRWVSIVLVFANARSRISSGFSPLIRKPDDFLAVLPAHDQDRGEILQDQDVDTLLGQVGDQ
jgi:hypothetical protein